MRLLSRALTVLLLVVIPCSASSDVIGTPTTLGERSRFGPAIVYGNSPTKVLLGWTGTDGRINFMPRDGATWGRKTTLNVTSNLAPALAFFNGIYVAAFLPRDSTDGELTVIRSFDGQYWSVKSGVGERSEVAPALATFNGRIYLAWRGRRNKYLNVMSSTDGVTWGGKVTLTETSDSPPALAATNTGLLIAWRGVGNNRLNVMRSPDGITFGGKMTLDDTTLFHPALAATLSHVVLAWQGTSNDKINVRVSMDGGASWQTKRTSGNRGGVDGGIALASADGSFLQLSWVIAWTGTDFHLNLGALPPAGPYCPAVAWYNGSQPASFDGANCYVANLSASGEPFIYAGNYYVVSESGPNCPLDKCICPRGAFDIDEHCFIMVKPPTGFIWRNGFYQDAGPNHRCPAGWSYDGAHCFFGEAPWGTVAFEAAGKFYTTRRPYCEVGSFDGANCFIGRPPSGRPPFIYEGGFYYQ